MASQYEPESLPIVDPGYIPFFKIDGMESYILGPDGYAYSRYYIIEPLPQRATDFSPFRPMVKKLNLILMVHQAAQDVMRAQVEEAKRRGQRMLVTIATIALLI